MPFERFLILLDYLTGINHCLENMRAGIHSLIIQQLLSSHCIYEKLGVFQLFWLLDLRRQDLANINQLFWYLNKSYLTQPTQQSLFKNMYVEIR